MSEKIHTAELDLEQFSTETEESNLLTLDVWSYWHDNGYPVESILEAHSALSQKATEENTGHIVLKVESLSKPLNRADVVEDSISVWCCDCKGYQYHYSVDLEQQGITDWKSCPHIKAVSKAERAKADDQQTEL